MYYLCLLSHHGHSPVTAHVGQAIERIMRIWNSQCGPDWMRKTLHKFVKGHFNSYNPSP